MHSRPSKGSWFIALGASGAEGLCDLMTVLQALPPALPAVVLVVLHRPWRGQTHLRSVLARSTSLPVVVASEGERFKIGHTYIGTPQDHLSLARQSFGALIPDPHRVHGNRTIDLLFNSVAAHAGSCGIGIVLSGSMDDGSRGLAAIHHAGGVTMVVTPTGSPSRGMPENAISYDGAVSFVGSASEIGRDVSLRTARPISL